MRSAREGGWLKACQTGSGLGPRGRPGTWAGPIFLALVICSATALAQNKPTTPAPATQSKQTPATPGKTPALPAGKSAFPAKPATPANPVNSAPAQPAGPAAPVVHYPLGAITALAFSPDGKQLAAGTYGQVVLYDTATWQPIRTFRQVEDTARSLAFSPDGKRLAIGNGLPSRSGHVTLWDIDGSTPPKLYPKQADTIEAIAFDKAGKELLYGADDHKARFFPAIDATNGGTVLDEHNDRVQAVAFSPKEDFVFLTGGLDKIVKVWDMHTGHVVINFDQSEGGITGLAFLSNGVQFIGSSLDGKLYWWGIDYNTRKQAWNGYHFRTIDAHPDGVFALAGTPDGRRFVTGGADHAVCIWNPDGGRIQTFKDSAQPIYAVAITPDGKRAAGGGREGFVRIWDIDANKPVAILAPPPLPTPPVHKPVTEASALKHVAKRH
ncbi:MAG TPA: WD40 repeat domain-containing protein [Chthonomonadaceae bacterium]|nr:WD40 repeat domain-containing protein [Chthonomonadaceae bacterium]